MNERIKELLQSENKEDVFLGIELLYRTDSSYFKRTHSREIWYMDGYISHPLNQIFYSRDRSFSDYIFKEVYDYCEERNYWIYADNNK